MNTGHTCLSTLIAALLAVSTYAGGPWADNFDSYRTGSQIVGQGGWEAWDLDGNAAEAFVTSAQAFSGANSLAIDSAGGGLPDDIVQEYSVDSGIWILSAMAYIPSDMTGQNSFVMLNQYTPDGDGSNENWSTWFHFNTDTGLVTSEFEGVTTPLITDQWVEIRVLIDLEQDLQTITFDGNYLTQKSWSDGSPPQGTTTIGALDLYGDSASAMYYDDISLDVAPAAGACCLPDGTCDGDDVDQATCEGNGGTYQGDGSVCAAADATLACLFFGDCGTILNLPDENGSNFNIKGSTCDEENSCNLVGSNDFQAEINLPFDAEWTIAICGSSFDTLLRIGTDCCTADIASLDDGCGAINLQESFTADLKAGTYFVTIEGVGGGCGDFALDISAAGGPDCAWDLSEDGTVNGTDLILLLGAWGDPYGTPDLIELLGAWGDCE